MDDSRRTTDNNQKTNRINMSNKDIAIKVENLSKRYRIGLKEEMHDSIISAIFNFVKSPFRNYRKYRSLYKFDDSALSQDCDLNYNQSDIIWALRDVSFEVKKGEVIGIIGRNGAGKSTLLKILTKITDPTTGSAEIRGRVSSLLEVGTGFHQELTGRENVFLNGTILGMRKKEVERKFDQIVDFSGVERFIDTPVKRYSSGMKVRLAFAVAAHLEPEILLIDEVLAVGDIAFQNKCLGKMGSVVEEGRTVLFVSHNLAAVSSLCPKSILLDNGEVALYEKTNKVIERYISMLKKEPNISIRERTDRKGTGILRLTDFWLEGSKSRRLTSVACGEKLSFKFSYLADQNDVRLRFIISVYNEINQRILRFDSDVNPIQSNHWPREGIVCCMLSNPLGLRPGTYRVNISVFSYGVLADYIVDAIYFEVIEGDFFGTGKLPQHWPMFLIPNEWKLEH